MEEKSTTTHIIVWDQYRQYHNQLDSKTRAFASLDPLCYLQFSNSHMFSTPAILSVCHINSSKYAQQVILGAILKSLVKTVLKAHLFAAVLSQLSKFTADYYMLYFPDDGCINHMGVARSYCNILVVLYHSDLVCIHFVLLYNCVSMNND